MQESACQYENKIFICPGQHSTLAKGKKGGGAFELWMSQLETPGSASQVTRLSKKKVND